ncbi:MAG TPA: site-2 protease family protein [Candidatus Aquilonibacter sp.]|nr:site-2 protease family protein [Candidatus Aquilonibacter sp.]
MAQAARPTGILIGRVFGIPIYLHNSWFIIFALITLSLGMQFTADHPQWHPAQRWTLGIVTSLLFFGSVIFHELAHSIVARHYRIPVDSITLFVFGGLSHIERDPDSALQEFNIAIVGPLSSLFLAGCFYLFHLYALHIHANDMVAAVCNWLARINLLLGLFNLVPGFPLDGGRVLRGIAWGITKSFTRASQIASLSGSAFAYLMIFLGIWNALRGNWVGGLWIAFIGWFLLEASKESFAQVALKSTLTGVRAQDVMTPEIPTVARDISLDDYVHEVLRTGRRSHIVTGAGTPVGLVTLHSVRAVPRHEWANTSIQAVMVPIDRVHSARPEEPVLQVLERMQKEDINQMPVLSDSHIVGMIGRDTIIRILQTRLQAGQFTEAHQPHG